MLPYVGVLRPGLTKRKLSMAEANDGTIKGLHAPHGLISAGFYGDDMVQAWLCGTAVGLMLLRQEDAVSVDQAGRSEKMLSQSSGKAVSASLA
jgi:hypothetical protein